MELEVSARASTNARTSVIVVILVTQGFTVELTKVLCSLDAVSTVTGAALNSAAVVKVDKVAAKNHHRRFNVVAVIICFHFLVPVEVGMKRRNINANNASIARANNTRHDFCEQIATIKPITINNIPTKESSICYALGSCTRIESLAFVCISVELVHLNHYLKHWL